MENPSETGTRRGEQPSSPAEAVLVTDSAAQEENPRSVLHFLKLRASRSFWLNTGWKRESKLRAQLILLSQFVCGKQNQQEEPGAGGGWDGPGWGERGFAGMAEMGMGYLPLKCGDLSCNPSLPTVG